MIHHQTFLEPTTPVDAIIVRVAEFGWCGVDLFFVLSGFLITGILLDTKHNLHYFRDFYVRRVLRIFPLYYGFLFVSVVIASRMNINGSHLTGIWNDQAWYWLFASNFLVALRGKFEYGFVDVSWSLAVEEQFYLVWPLVVFKLENGSLRRLCVSAMVVALASRVILTLSGASEVSTYVLPFARMDALAVGALLSVYMREATTDRIFAVAKVVGPICAVVLLTGVLLGNSDEALHGLDTQWATPFVRTIGFTALAIGSASLVALALDPRSNLMQKALESRFLGVMGKYSFAMYLVHAPLRAVLRDRFFRADWLPTILRSAMLSQLVFYVLACSATLLVAVVSWQLYERPFLALKDRLAPRNRSRADPTAAPA